jgi:hypothetical protein
MTKKSKCIGFFVVVVGCYFGAGLTQDNLLTAGVAAEAASVAAMASFAIGYFVGRLEK